MIREIKFNVKDYCPILDKMQEFDAWGLFDKLGYMTREGYFGVSSPDMEDERHAKQKRLTWDLHCFRKAGKVPTYRTGQRRGYTAIIFDFDL